MATNIEQQQQQLSYGQTNQNQNLSKPVLKEFPVLSGSQNSSSNANLNTATFDHHGILWFTGQSGVYGRLDPSTEKIQVFKAPGGPGPYGITTTPNGDVYYASLAGSYVGHINVTTGTVTVLNPPTQEQGARRVWSDSHGRLWIREWNAGKLALYDPATNKWQEWRLQVPILCHLLYMWIIMIWCG